MYHINRSQYKCIFASFDKLPNAQFRTPNATSKLCLQKYKEMQVGNTFNIEFQISKLILNLGKYPPKKYFSKCPLTEGQQMSIHG